MTPLRFGIGTCDVCILPAPPGFARSNACHERRGSDLAQLFRPGANSIAIGCIIALFVVPAAAMAVTYLPATG